MIDNNGQPWLRSVRNVQNVSRQLLRVTVCCRHILLISIWQWVKTLIPLLVTSPEEVPLLSIHLFSRVGYDPAGHIGIPSSQTDTRWKPKLTTSWSTWESDQKLTPENEDLRPPSVGFIATNSNKSIQTILYLFLMFATGRNRQKDRVTIHQGTRVIVVCLIWPLNFNEFHVQTPDMTWNMHRAVTSKATIGWPEP